MITLKEIKTIKTKDYTYYVNPFFVLKEDRSIYELYDFFSKKILIKWANKKKNSEDQNNFIHKFEDVIQREVILNSYSEFLLRYYMRNSMIHNFRSEIPIGDIAKMLDLNLNNYYIYKYYFEDLNIRKATILASLKQKSKNTRNFSIFETSGLISIDENVRKIIKDSDIVLFERKFGNRHILGPFLEGSHLCIKNIDVINGFNESPVIEFYDKNIAKLGINKFIKYHEICAIIECVTNYLYESCPLYNRCFNITDNGIVSVSDIIPLF